MRVWFVALMMLVGGATATAATAQVIDGPEALARPGWRIEYVVRGDISRDGRDDLAVVMQQTDPANIVSHDGLGAYPYDSNPRALIVALGEARGFRIVARDEALITRRVTPTMDDPLQEAPWIENGVLKVRLEQFMSAGGWSMGNLTFTLRWQDGDVRLIGYDRNTIQRNTGETETVSVNLLTGRRSMAVGSISDSAEPTPVWSRVRRGAIPLGQVGDGFRFEWETFDED